MIRSLTAAVLSSTLLAAHACAQMPGAEPAHAQSATLNLSATGEVASAPDIATVSLGVVSQAPNAGEAMQANARQMNAVFTALQGAGIEERDIQTSGLSLGPVYSNTSSRPQGEPRITGYRASNTVTARVRDLDSIGGVIDAAIGAGANTLQGLSFGLIDRQAAEDEARQRAFAELERLAGIYEAGANVRIERVMTLSESRFTPGPRPMMMARAESLSTPVASGEVGVQVTINAVYEIREADG
ncbi:MAG: SIMPL domain-containing protein [Pseudomonadota bacterium]